MVTMKATRIIVAIGEQDGCRTMRLLSCCYHRHEALRVFATAPAYVSVKHGVKQSVQLLPGSPGPWHVEDDIVETSTPIATTAMVRRLRTRSSASLSCPSAVSHISRPRLCR